MKIPATVYEAIDEMVSTLTPEHIEYIKTHDRYSLHHGFGTGLRNEWKLWDRNSPLVKWCISELKIGHGDDISGLILTGIWQKASGQPVDLAPTIESFHQHWLKAGVDPVTQEPLNKPEQPDEPVKPFLIRVGNAIIRGITFKW